MAYKNIDLEINYTDLRNELIAAIPQLSEKWTDHNVSDFGVMILELYAYLSDAYLYKINQVDDSVLSNFFSNQLVTKQMKFQNVDLTDKFDYEFEKLKKYLDEGSAAKTDSDVVVRNFFQKPYRLITREDTETICIDLIENLSVDGVQIELKGLNVKHDPVHSKFDIVMDIDALTTRNTDDIIRNAFLDISTALNKRKLLGSTVNIREASKLFVRNVQIKLKYNVENSSWSRNPEEIIINAVESYFKNNTRTQKLSLDHYISLFEIYNELENLPLVDFIESINVTLFDEKNKKFIYLSESPEGPDGYNVALEFSGEIAFYGAGAEAVVKVEQYL